MSSFETDIKPLFRAFDIEEMEFAFNLGDYEDVKANASGILDRLEAGDMPCDGAWPPEQVETFRAWVSAGMPA